MVLLPLRQLPARPNSTIADAWLEQLDGVLRDPGTDRSLLCRRTLAELCSPEYAANWDTAVADEALPLGTRLALSSLDPRNVTLEPEYYADCDNEKFQRVKPLLWLWYSFDRSPLGGQNVDLGVRLRRLLAPHIFRRCGENFKCFQHVEFSFGYNMEVGDNCVVHRHVLLDDRGGIVMGNAVTVLEDGVRITYHATVLAGVRVGVQGMVGANAVATKDVEPYHVNVGIPAKTVRVKPNAPAELVGEVLSTTRRGTRDQGAGGRDQGG